MTTSQIPNIREDSADLSDSQHSSSPEAISGRDESPAASQRPLKKTVAALDRHVEACHAMIERTKEKIKAAKALPVHKRDEATVPALNRQLDNLEERKKILLRLRAREVRYDDR